MGSFDYITVLVAVVVGLAIGDQALSLHKLVRDRSRVRSFWDIGYLRHMMVA